MDQNTYSSTSSLCSSSSHQQSQRKTIKSSLYFYNNSLHSVRKSLQKPITKHFIAPLPPTPPKVYDVHVADFKDVVRVLTSSPEFQNPSTRRLKDIAPPPLVISRAPKPSSPAIKMSPDFCKLISESPEMMDCLGDLSQAGLGFSLKPGPHELSESELVSPLGMSLSPTTVSWCSSVLLSPL
ncbi:hypothetical protein LXL04_006653 [Taraxacum kok-saghyz]